ncbi:flavodoxin family protein [candidate division WOR-3 bacterium]|nr:flavodoxin family protein [candidate division WOR-3 bacterium]
MKVVAINGSPRMDKGNTAMIVAPFIQGMTDAGSDVELFYTRRLKVKPCTCNEMFCWYSEPGECCIKDDMQLLYPKLREADILVLATPVYIPLPGDMQIIINRLCPLIEPFLETRKGRTRARFHDNVKIRKIVLVSTGGWWEKGNFGTVVRIVEELAEDASVEFAGAVLRPHAFLMKKEEELTKDGKAVVSAVRRAGYELIKEGGMNRETLETVSHPLISEEELRHRYNKALEK